MPFGFILDAPVQCCQGKGKYTDIKEPVGKHCIGLCEGYEMTGEIEKLLGNSKLLRSKHKDTIKSCFERYSKWEKKELFSE